jgi:Uma2 family endonuclease
MTTGRKRSVWSTASSRGNNKWNDLGGTAPMSIVTVPDQTNDYPTTDGRPMAETDWHRDLMMDLILTLQAFFAGDDQVYVSGNLLIFYVPGDRRRHLSPDVFVVKGVGKHQRSNYLIWKEGRGPDIVIEITSPTTREEDLDHKMTLYRDVLKVPEYFLFDPKLEYLDPPMQGFRLHDGKYLPIEPVNGRLPSEVLGLHLEQDRRTLRLYNPATGERLPTTAERLADYDDLVESEREARENAAASQQREHAMAAELDRLRRELEQAHRSPPTPPPAAAGGI